MNKSNAEKVLLDAGAQSIHVRGEQLITRIGALVLTARLHGFFPEAARTTWTFTVVREGQNAPILVVTTNREDAARAAVMETLRQLGVATQPNGHFLAPVFARLVEGVRQGRAVTLEAIQGEPLREPAVAAREAP